MQDTKTGISKPARLIKIDWNLEHDWWGYNIKTRVKYFSKLLGYELIGDEVDLI